MSHRPGGSIIRADGWQKRFSKTIRREHFHFGFIRSCVFSVMVIGIESRIGEQSSSSELVYCIHCSNAHKN